MRLTCVFVGQCLGAEGEETQEGKEVQEGEAEMMSEENRVISPQRRIV
jgi:hypothetical protein